MTKDSVAFISGEGVMDQDGGSNDSFKRVILENLPVSEKIQMRSKVKQEEGCMGNEEIWQRFSESSGGVIKSSASGLVEIIQALRTGGGESTRVSSYCDSIEELVVLDSINSGEWEKLVVKRDDDSSSGMKTLRNIRRIKFINCDLVINSREMSSWLEWLFEHISIGAGDEKMEVHFRDCRFYYSSRLKIDSKRRRILGGNEEGGLLEDESFIYVLFRRIKEAQEKSESELLSFNLVNTVMNEVQLRNILVWLLDEVGIKLCELRVNQLLVWRRCRESTNMTILSQVANKMDLGNRELPNLVSLRTLSFHSNNLNDQEAELILENFVRLILSNNKETGTRILEDSKVYFDFRNNFITDRFLEAGKGHNLGGLCTDTMVELEINLTGNPICDISTLRESLPGNVNIIFDHFFPITLSEELLAHWSDNRNKIKDNDSRLLENRTLTKLGGNGCSPMPHLLAALQDREPKGIQNISQASIDSFFDKNDSLMNNNKSECNDSLYDSEDDEDYQQENESESDTITDTDSDLGTCSDLDAKSDDPMDIYTDTDTDTDPKSDTKSIPELQENIHYSNQNIDNVDTIMTSEEMTENSQKPESRSKEKVQIVREDNAIESLISEARANYLNYKRNQDKLK
ncbi:hypothetical protein OIY81_2197 [Cryptosporidium canis]|nr:hypothetical protein OIY81_2197 [Cryptosporidium canis]